MACPLVRVEASGASRGLAPPYSPCMGRVEVEDSRRSGRRRIPAVDMKPGFLQTFGENTLHRRSLLTTASSIAIVTSVLGGVLVALALQVFSRPATAVTIVTGLVSATVVALAFLRHGTNRWRRVEAVTPLCSNDPRRPQPVKRRQEPRFTFISSSCVAPDSRCKLAAQQRPYP